MDIKNLKGEVIYSSDKTTLKEVLEEAVKNRANLRDADLENANLQDANLQDANLRGANLRDADLENANLQDASLRNANLLGTSLLGANLQNTDLRGANLQDADLRNANLQNANLQNTDLWDADLQDADLRNAIGLIKIIGVKPGGIYWKRFDENLNNYGYQFKVGMNTLRKGEIFADDERVTCSFPGFHFASRSWCALHHPERFLEAKIRIPEDAKINEPWATDGKASADKIEILQVFNTKTGEDVTDQYRQKED